MASSRVFLTLYSSLIFKNNSTSLSVYTYNDSPLVLHRCCFCCWAFSINVLFLLRFRIRNVTPPPLGLARHWHRLTRALACGRDYFKNALGNIFKQGWHNYICYEHTIRGLFFHRNSPGHRHSKYASADDWPETNPARVNLCVREKGKVNEKRREQKDGGEGKKENERLAVFKMQSMTVRTESDREQALSVSSPQRPVNHWLR